MGQRVGHDRGPIHTDPASATRDKGPVPFVSSGFSIASLLWLPLRRDVSGLCPGTSSPSRAWACGHLPYMSTWLLAEKLDKTCERLIPGSTAIPP